MQGLGKSCLYCGDGINDLEALANAEVGMAVGSAEASAAATFCDTHYSIAGQQVTLLCTPFYTSLFCTPFSFASFVCASFLCTAGSFACAIQGWFSPSPVLWCISSHMLPISRCDKNALAAVPPPQPLQLWESCSLVVCLITVQSHESHELDCKALSNHQLLLVAYLYSIRFCHYVCQHQHLASLLQSSGQ